MDSCTVIVNYLPDDIDLLSIFSPYGNVSKATIAKDRVTGANLSYAFITFDRPEHAQSAIAALNGQHIGNKQIKVSIARNKIGNIADRKLFVRGLPLQYTEKDVWSLFSEYGEIIECRLLKEADHTTSKGRAFVEFMDAISCKRAVQSLHETIPPGATNRVQVYYAKPPPATQKSDTPNDSALHGQSRPPIHSASPIHRTGWGSPMSFHSSPSAPFSSPYSGQYVPAIASNSYQCSPGIHSTATSSTLEQHSIKICGIPHAASAKVVISLFEPYGHIIAVDLDHILQTKAVFSCGTATAVIVSSHEMIDLLFHDLHNRLVFAGYPPVQLFLLT